MFSTMNQTSPLMDQYCCLEHLCYYDIYTAWGISAVTVEPIEQILFQPAYIAD